MPEDLVSKLQRQSLGLSGLLQEIARRLSHIMRDDLSQAERQIAQLLVDNEFGEWTDEHEPEFRAK